MITQKEVSDLPLSEKLNLMELLWKEISQNEEAVEVPQWHKELLDEREAKIRKGEAKFIPWEEAKRQIDQRCR
jgi:putative addiction module component (TIGR02574 family)